MLRFALFAAIGQQVELHTVIRIVRVGQQKVLGCLADAGLLGGTEVFSRVAVVGVLTVLDFKKHQTLLRLVKTDQVDFGFFEAVVLREDVKITLLQPVRGSLLLGMAEEFVLRPRKVRCMAASQREPIRAAVPGKPGRDRSNRLMASSRI